MENERERTSYAPDPLELRPLEFLRKRKAQTSMLNEKVNAELIHTNVQFYP